MKAIIVGAGPGLSASFARSLAGAGYHVALAARGTEKLADLAEEIGASRHVCDAALPVQVASLFAAVPDPDVVLFNAGQRARGKFAELDPVEVERVLINSAFAGFLVAQMAAQAMLKRGRGTILITGASASVKGYPQSAPFAMAKFALRGMAQSMARELHPKGIHVVHVVVDGGIRSAARPNPSDAPDSLLDPDAIAQSMLDLVAQPRSCWSDELAVRPWVERF